MTRQRYPCRPTILFLVGLFAALIPSAQGTIIDDFSTPQGPLTGVADVASGPGIVGGFREASDPNFAVSGGVATFSFSIGGTGTNIMGLAYDGTMDPSDGGMFAPLVDLTDGGLASQFLLGISEVTGVFSLAIGITDADSNVLPLIFNPVISPGLYTLPIAPGTADLTRVSRIDMALFLSPSQAGQASVGIDFMCTGTAAAGCTSVDSVTTVPEPGTAMLLIVGAAMLALLQSARLRKPRVG